MKKSFFIILLTIFNLGLFSQSNMTPERLIQLGKVSGMGIDNDQVIFKVSQYSFETKTKTSTNYSVDIDGNNLKKLSEKEIKLANKEVSPDGKYKIEIQDEKLKKISGTDFHPKVEGTDVMIFDDLNYRHWDHYEDGAYSHVMYHSTTDMKAKPIDIMGGEPFDCPQQPFGGDDDYLWSPDSKKHFVCDQKVIRSGVCFKYQYRYLLV